MAISNLVVRYRNEINRASHTLSTIESRIILTAIAQVPAGEVSDHEIYWITASDLKELGTSSTKVYARLREASRNLFHRYITIPEYQENGVATELTFRWIQSVRYQEGSGKIGIRFSSEIMPFISQIQSEFTKYNLIEIKDFTYLTTRIYALLAQYVDTGFFVIQVSELRNALELTNQYATYGNLKQRVLAPAIKAINESDTARFKVIMREKKLGRRVDQLMFSIKVKDANTFDSNVDVDTGDILADGLTRKEACLSDAQIRMYADFLAGVNKKYEQIATSFYSEARKQGLVNWEGKSHKACSDDLVKKLRDPDFVIAIYGWLKKLGFKH